MLPKKPHGKLTFEKVTKTSIVYGFTNNYLNCSTEVKVKTNFLIKSKIAFFDIKIIKPFIRKALKKSNYNCNGYPINLLNLRLVMQFI
jgi:hypothetical protein